MFWKFCEVKSRSRKERTRNLKGSEAIIRNKERKKT